MGIRAGKGVFSERHCSLTSTQSAQEAEEDAWKTKKLSLLSFRERFIASGQNAHSRKGN